MAERILTQLYFDENIPMTQKDRANILNGERLSNCSYGYKLNQILDISNYVPLEGDIASSVKPYMPDTGTRYGYMNDLIDYTDVIGSMTSNDFGDMYFKAVNAMSTRINQIIYNGDMFGDLTTILNTYIKVSNEADIITGELYNLMEKLYRFSESSSTFDEVMLSDVISDYDDISELKEHIKTFNENIENTNNVDTELFNRIFVVLTMRLQTIFNNLQFIGQATSYYTEEMFIIPNSFCVNVLKLGVVTSLGIYMQTAELRTIIELFKDFLSLYEAYKDDLLIEDTSKYFISNIRDEINFRMDAMYLYSDSIYSKIGNGLPITSQLLDKIYQASINDGMIKEEDSEGEGESSDISAE